ncbi:hypothetical protein TYRP_009618 [Tyrophagus putrescentiae]|nr:hypothetical protein TYRP_009618 [Tyrophagus putrescentiae]
MANYVAVVVFGFVIGRSSVFVGRTQSESEIGVHSIERSPVSCHFPTTVFYFKSGRSLKLMLKHLFPLVAFSQLFRNCFTINNNGNSNNGSAVYFIFLPVKFPKIDPSGQMYLCVSDLMQCLAIVQRHRTDDELR